MTTLPGVHSAHRHRPVGALQQVCYGRAADALMGFVHLHQKSDISGRVLAGKGGAGGAVALGKGHRCQAVPGPLGNQPGDLRAAVAAGVPEVAQQHTAFAFIALEVVKTLEHASDVLVAFNVIAVP